LDEVELRTAATLTVPMARSRPIDADDCWDRVPRWKIVVAMWAQRLGWPRRPVELDARMLDELYWIGDAMADAGLLLPSVAFAVYRKRRV
jgi:hypothetical protein